MKDWTDKRLFEGLRRGEEEALSVLFLRYYDFLKHYGVKMSGNRDLVENCIQDLFIHLFESSPKGGEVILVRAYLFKALRRRVVFAMTKEKRSRERAVSNLYKVDLQFNPTDLIVLQEYQDRCRSVLLHCLNQLPWRQREAIYLRYYNGLSTREIAEVMGAANQTILNTLYQALNKLRTQDDLRNLRSET